VKYAHKLLVGDLEEKRPFGRPRRRWGIILKWILGKSGLGCRLDLSGSGQEPMAGNCECGNEPLGFIKCGKFFY
jgi:hypothetical protein